VLKFAFLAVMIAIITAITYVVAFLPVKYAIDLFGIFGALGAFIIVFIAAVVVDGWLDKRH
jgi:small-conductance mechanosensitive channel